MSEPPHLQGSIYAGECTHRIVDAFAIAEGDREGEPVEFWACRLCGRRFEPTRQCRCGRPWREHETHYPSRTTVEQDVAASQPHPPLTGPGDPE